MKMIRVHKPGGPEVLRLEDIETPEQGVGQVLTRVEVAGVNYADTGVRRGRGLELSPGGDAPDTGFRGRRYRGRARGVQEASPGCTRVAAVLESGGSTPNTRSLTLV